MFYLICFTEILESLAPFYLICSIN